MTIREVVRSTPDTPVSARSGRYDAFISYDHDDSHVAEAIQRGLHRVGRRMGQLRALRVFRDATDLTANPDLWGKITEALDASRFVVLVASPKSAASIGVDKELEHWIARRGVENLLLVVADGELAWDDDTGGFDAGRSSALPRLLADPELFETEPLFVDVSSHRSLDLSDLAFRDRIIDLAAPLHGKEKEAFANEDRRELRRFRRWRRAAVIGLAILLVAALIATIVAVLQLNEAQGQRRESETQSELADSEADRANTEADRANAEADVANARLLAARADARVHDQTDLALLLAVESLAVQHTDEGWAALAAGLTQEVSRLTPLAPSVGFWSSIAMSADGTLLAAAGGDRIQMWNPSTREAVGQPLQLEGVDSIAVTRDGRLLAGATSGGGHVRVWDVAARTLVAERRFDELLEDLTFSPDGSMLAIGGSAEAILIWDTDGPIDEVRQLKLPQLEVNDLAFSPDGKLLVAGTHEGSVEVFDVSTGQVINRLPGGSTVESLDFSSDGIVLAYTTRFDGVRFWDFELAEEVKGFPGPETMRLAFRPGGYELVWAAFDDTRVDAKVNFWSLGTRNETYDSYESFFHEAAFNDDGSLLSWMNPSAVELTTFGVALEPDAPRQTPSYVRDLAIDPKSGVVASADWSGAVHFVDPDDSSADRSVDAHDVVWKVAIGPTGSTMATGGSDPPLLLWREPFREPEQIDLAELGDRVTVLAFSSDGSLLAAGGGDGGFVVIDVASGELAYGPLNGHSGSTTAVVFSPDGSVISGGDDGMVIHWALAVGEHRSIGSFDTEEHRSVTSIAVDGSGSRVAATHGGELRIWDVRDGASHLVAGRSTGGETVHFSHTAPLVFTTEPSGLAIWSSETLELAGFVPSVRHFSMDALAIGAADDVVVTGYSGLSDRGGEPDYGLVQFWHGPADWVDLACEQARRPLTQDEAAQFLHVGDGTELVC